jgi:hypothetical protein
LDKYGGYKMTDANLTTIIVPSGIQPVHSFDLWGTIVIQDVLGPRVLEAYKELMEEEGMPEEEIAQNIANYQGILNGDPKALENKKAFVDTVEDPLWEAYTDGRADVNFDGAIYGDALASMGDISRDGESLCVLTTGNSPWVPKALASLDPDVGRTLRKVYSGDKTRAVTFEDTAADLNREGGQMVSHSEDQLKGLAGLLASPLQTCVNSIYVERTNLATAEEVLAQGVTAYVKDLGEVNYTSIAEMR